MRLIDAERGDGGVALLFGCGQTGDGDREHQRHRRQQGPALAGVAHGQAKGVDQRGGNQQHRDHLQEIAQRVRILIGVGRVGAEKPPAIGAQLLDRLLRRHWPHGQNLLGDGHGLLHRLPGGIAHRLARGVQLGRHVGRGLQRGDGRVGREGLDDALADQGHRQQHRQGQQGIDRDAIEIHPEVADLGGTVTRESPDQGKGHGDARRCRDEVLHRQPHHLREVAQGRFARIALPVGIGDKTDGGVETGVGADRAELLRVERQHALQPLQRIHQQRAQQAEHQQGHGIARPAHPGGIDAAQPQQTGLQPGQRPPGGTAVHDPGEVTSQGAGRAQNHQEQHRQQGEEFGRHQKSSARNSAASR